MIEYQAFVQGLSDWSQSERSCFHAHILTSFLNQATVTVSKQTEANYNKKQIVYAMIYIFDITLMQAVY